MKILFACYREWAKETYRRLKREPMLGNHICDHVSTPEELNSCLEQSWDVVILIGWSWKVSADFIKKHLVIGMHPSDLPEYSGGSPIHNQILNGIKSTNASLFRLNEKFDEGEIIDKCPIDLTGHLCDIFESISAATIKMVLRFIENYPNNTYQKQIRTDKTISVKRLKPEQSQLNHQMTCEELWDNIRCREDPYPNAYFEDETGRLIVKWVEFEPAKK